MPHTAATTGEVASAQAVECIPEADYRRSTLIGSKVRLFSGDLELVPVERGVACGVGANRFRRSRGYRAGRTCRPFRFRFGDAEHFDAHAVDEIVIASARLDVATRKQTTNGVDADVQRLVACS